MSVKTVHFRKLHKELSNLLFTDCYGKSLRGFPAEVIKDSRTHFSLIALIALQHIIANNGIVEPALFTEITRQWHSAVSGFSFHWGSSIKRLQDKITAWATDNQLRLVLYCGLLPK